MSILRVYADEAGTIPMTDDDGIFVASTIGIIGNHPARECFR